MLYFMSISPHWLLHIGVIDESELSLKKKRRKAAGEKGQRKAARAVLAVQPLEAEDEFERARR